MVLLVGDDSSGWASAVGAGTQNAGGASFWTEPEDGEGYPGLANGTAGTAHILISAWHTAPKLKIVAVNAVTRAKLAESAEITPSTIVGPYAEYSASINVPIVEDAPYLLVASVPSGYVDVVTHVGTANQTASVTVSYESFPDPLPARASTTYPQFAIWLEGGEESDAPVVTNVSDASIKNGQTGIVVTLTGGSASGKTVVISPEDDIDAVGAVSQTVTAQNLTTVTITGVRGALAFGAPAYLFVRNSDGTASEEGTPVSFVPSAAAINLTLVDEHDAPLAGATVDRAEIWLDDAINGNAPDVTLTGLTANGSGVVALNPSLGESGYFGHMFYVLTHGSPPTQFHCGRKLPTYT